MDKYPHLIRYVPEEYKGDAEKLLRYVCLVYDPQSKLIRDTSNYEVRKRTAAELAGYSAITKDDNNLIDELLEMKDEEVIHVVDLFLKMEIKERLWYMIQGNEQTFYEYGKRLVTPIKWGNGINSKEKDEMSAIAIKTKLSNDMAVILEQLEKDYNKFYADDTQLIKVIAKRRYSPEEMNLTVK